jgi:GYD domain
MSALGFCTPGHSETDDYYHLTGNQFLSVCTGTLQGTAKGLCVGGVEIKQAFITTGDSDLLLIIDAPDGGNVTKFALAISSQGNIRTRTARAWPEAEYVKMISELPR